MAQYNGSSSSSISPIMSLPQDHLYTIVLLLPVDSILSFSITCKRFKSWICFDSLWESICRRDWGAVSVDALKSSSGSNTQRLPWMRLYKEVYRLDSVSCRKLADSDSQSLFPSPRASHSLNFVSDCLVLFGGGCEGGRHLDDTWVAYVGNDIRRTFKWQKIDSGVPSGRFGHACVTIGHNLVLFGGINDRGIRQNDTWVGQVFRDNHHISISWRLLNVQSVAPPPRGAHAACNDGERKIVIQGGIGLNGLRLGDTWILELSENLCDGTWHEVVIQPSPPPRSGHTLTYIGGTGMVLFGGRGLGYEVLNDVWLLQMSEGHLKWVHIFYEPQNITGGVSLPRVGHSATLILGSRVLIYGGEDSQRHRKDDFWVLDISSILPNQVQPSPTRTNMWRRLKTKGYKPNKRSFHRACTDDSGCYIYVFGGMIDGLIQPAEASAMKFDGELFLVELGTLF
ncbi:F-box/kelch-repeat protein At1g51550 [Euphorbia lathyris]|uniref:F-box/kelch-repeat protein At1g51550 n=1 Tax=Euphorbia lathyris TaxID=212925 RepID=UPI0033138EDF